MPYVGLQSDILGTTEGSLNLNGIHLSGSLHLTEPLLASSPWLLRSSSCPSSPAHIPHSRVLASKPHLVFNLLCLPAIAEVFITRVLWDLLQGT